MNGFSYPGLVLLARTLLLCALFTIVIMAFTPLMAKLPSGGLSDKLYHIAAFATLMVLSVISFPRSPVQFLAIALLLFGVSIEVVQSVPALNRSAEGLDIVADGLGILAGFAFCLGLRLVFLRRIKLLVSDFEAGQRT